MAAGKKRIAISRENVLRVFAGEKRVELTGKAVLTRLDGRPESEGKVDKLLRRLVRDGVLEKEGRKYRLVQRETTAALPGEPELSPEEQFPSKRQIACALGSLALLVMIAFYPGLGGEFLVFDDPKYVSRNSNIQSLSWQTVEWAFTSFHAANWHPLTWLSLAVDYKFYELEPFGYHLTNLIFHTLNSLLVFVVLFRLTGAFWSSLAVAVLFGLHPLRVESVSWVSERKDVLSAFFWLLTMMAYLRYVRLKSVASYLLVAFTFGLGLMSKPIVVTLPAVLLLIDYWPLRRLNWKAVWEKLPLVGITFASVALTIAAQKGGGAVQNEYIPFIERIANALVSYVRYVSLTIWPHDLSPFYSHPSLAGPPLPPVRVIGAAVVLAGITALVLHKNIVKSILPVGWFWFLGTLVPMIGIFQVGRQGMADRYTYIPHIGLMILLVWGIASLPIWHSSRARGIGFALVAVIALTLGTLTWKQTAVWQDSFSLWKHTVERSPYSFIGHQGLGLEYRRRGQTDEAITELQKASALRPKVSSVHRMLGDLFSSKKDFDSALTHYQEAAGLEPNSARYQNKIGLTLLRLGRWRDARDPIEKALAIDSNYAAARVSLGRYWLAAGNPLKAANEFEAALYIAPNYKLASRYLEIARKRLGLD